MIPDNNFTLQAAKAHLRVPHAEEDAVIVAMLDGAVAACERYTRRAWTKRKWSVAIPANACACSCSAEFHALLSPATARVYAFAADGSVEETAAIVGTVYGSTVVILADPSAFVATQGDAGRIDYEAAPPDGYVPPDIYAAVMLYLGDLFENREAQVVGTVVAQNAVAELLLRPYVLEMHA